MALRALQLTTRALRPGVMTLGAQSALRTRFAYPMVPSFQHIDSRHIWSLPYLRQYVAAKLRPKREPGPKEKPLEYDKYIEKDGRELWIPRPPPNYDQINTPEGYKMWVMHLQRGLTQRKCEKLAREVEDHLNDAFHQSSVFFPRKASPREIEGRPYRVCPLFVREMGEEPSRCQLIFNYHQGGNPHVAGFMIDSLFDRVEKPSGWEDCERPAVLTDKPEPSTDAEPIKYDMHMEGKDEVWTPHYPENYEQLVMREGYTPWVLHLKNGLTKNRCKSLAGEVEKHLNELASALKGHAQARTTMDDSKTDSRSAEPYRVLTLFVGEYGGAPSHCQLIFNYPKGENPCLGGFLMTDDFGRVDKTAGPLEDAGSISGIGQNERLSVV